jgi:ATP-dependent helicase/nuclease subunit B
MPDSKTGQRRPSVLTVPFGTDFCDATAAHILSQASTDPLAISNMVVLLPNNRAIKSMTEAFVRRAAPGLLLPRMVAIGDLALDETLGPLLDPLTADEAIWPAIDSTSRTLLLAGLILKHRPTGQTVSAAEALRLAQKLAEMIDELEIEQVGLERLADLNIEADLAEHWQRSFGQILALVPAYSAELSDRKLLGPAERRNILLGRLEKRLREAPPATPIIAAGITTSAKAVTRLLRQITRLDCGTVILPGVDLAMPDAQWDALLPKQDESEPKKPLHNVETHPQFHLRLLLDRMGINRQEIGTMALASGSSANPVIADVFCLPALSAQWRDLPTARKRLPNVKLVEAADSPEEARIIAVRVREAIEQPGKRVAVITPDRELATRVAAQLRRWEINVDDSAGRPLLQTPEGMLILALAETMANRFAATNVFGIAKHPLVKVGEGRLAWLDDVRKLDLFLRGPAEGIGLQAISARLETNTKIEQATVDWWSGFSGTLQILERSSKANLAEMLAAIQTVADQLTDGRIWKGASGRELARVWEEIAACNLSAIPLSDSSAIPAILTELFSRAVVRPPYGGHPRVAIYGLLEARMQQADVVICGGLNEMTWPQIAQPDPWLAPAIRRHLGLATLDRNIGLSAHDLATALGAKDVLLTRARRDRSGPTVASRFLLRIKALFGDELQVEAGLPALAANFDRPAINVPFASRPVPTPSPEQRRVTLSITNFDQLKSDPYSFYAKKILGLKALDPIDAEPSHAWRGTLVHEILQHWFEEDDCAPEKLLVRAEALLTNGALDPLLRTLWQPRIAEGLRWIAHETQRMRDEEGRRLLIAEKKGEMQLLGVSITGRADRIDALADGSLVIIDYKTGMPAKPRQVNAGFALQLGLVGLMAERGAIKGVSGDALRFEYWSLAKNKDRHFGYVSVATSTKPNDNKHAPDAFVGFIKMQAEEALKKWILGAEPFTAKLHPEYSNYADYDQLMRLQEWNGRQAIAEGDEA